MTNISPEQCRAARALLDWDQRELSRRSKVTQPAIAQFERGKTIPWPRTIYDLKQAFDAAGVEFLDAVEGQRGIGVQMRDGFPAITKTVKSKANQADEDTGGNLEAFGWEWSTDDADFGQAAPLSWTDEDRANQIAYWRGRPEKWAALAEVSRQCLLRAMGVERL